MRAVWTFYVTVSRGIRSPLTITTDGAVGMPKAVDALWPKSWRIRCWFHKMQNLLGKVPPEAWTEFKALVIDVRDAPDFDEDKKRLLALVATKEREFPEACRCLKDSLEASLNHLRVPHRHRQMVRTTNIRTSPAARVVPGPGPRSTSPL